MLRWQVGAACCLAAVGGGVRAVATAACLAGPHPALARLPTRLSRRLLCQTIPPHHTPRLPPAREWPIPEEHYDTDGGGLLRYVARCTAEVVRQHSAGGTGDLRPVIGFCFSFPVDQTALDNGRVLVWTKVRPRAPGGWVGGCRVCLVLGVAPA